MKKLFTLLLLTLMTLSLFACGKEKENLDNVGAVKPSQNQSSNKTTDPTPEPTPRPDIQMSDNIEDFTVTINGLTYQLGCGIDVFLNDGWVPKSGYVLESDYKIPSGDTRGVILYKGSKDNMISVTSYYTAEGESAYHEGIVLGVHSEEGSTAEVIFSGNLSMRENLTLDNVTSVFGTDYTKTDMNGDRYVFRIGEKGSYIFTFNNSKLTYWEYRLNKKAV